MFEKINVYLDGKFCQYREYEYGKEWKRIRESVNEISKRETGHPDYTGLICPLCNKEFEVGQIAYMVINNYKLFPNTIIHKDCVKEGNLELTSMELKEKYDRFVTFMNENKVWL